MNKVIGLMIALVVAAGSAAYYYYFHMAEQPVAVHHRCQL